MKKYTRENNILAKMTLYMFVYLGLWRIAWWIDYWFPGLTKLTSLRIAIVTLCVLLSIWINNSLKGGK